MEWLPACSDTDKHRRKSHERNKAGDKLKRLTKGYLKFYLNSTETIRPFSDCINIHVPTCIRPCANCVK